MARIRDPLKYGYYAVDYVLWGKNRVAVHFDLAAAESTPVALTAPTIG